MRTFFAEVDGLVEPGQRLFELGQLGRLLVGRGMW
jgi:hypothetical protein